MHHTLKSAKVLTQSTNIPKRFDGSHHCHHQCIHLVFRRKLPQSLRRLRICICWLSKILLCACGYCLCEISNFWLWILAKSKANDNFIEAAILLFLIIQNYDTYTILILVYFCFVPASYYNKLFYVQKYEYTVWCFMLGISLLLTVEYYLGLQWYEVWTSFHENSSVGANF